MTPDEHNPEGTDHAAQGHYLAASRTTPPAPTPALPPEVREAIAAEIYGTPYASLQASDRLSVDFACAALAPLWPRPVPVTADAMALWKQAKGAYLFGTYRHEDNANEKAAAVLAPVVRERDDLRAEVLRLQGIACTNADQLATAERVLDAYRVQLSEAKQEARHD